MAKGKESKPSGNKWAVMGGIALNVEYTRKYGFEATGAAQVTAKLVAIPPPVAFQEAVQADIAGRQKRAALLAAGAGGLAQPARLLLPEEPPVEVGQPILADDEETLSLMVPDAAGIDYVLDDGVNPPSSGRVGADGGLIHRVSPESKGAVLRFANRSEPVVFSFDRSDEGEISEPAADEELLETEEPDEDGLDKGLDEDGTEEREVDEEDLEDEQSMEEIVELLDDDDAPTLSLVVPDKANKSYALDDGINPPSDGVVDANGLLVHPVSREATGARLNFEDQAKAIQLRFSTE